MTLSAAHSMALSTANALLSGGGLDDRPPVPTRILYGDLRTGRITGVLPVTGVPSWSRVQNDSGGIDGVVVHGTQVRKLALWANAAPARTFLAVEQGDRIRQAGPLWKHRWSRRSRRLTLASGDLLSLLDHRKVVRVLAAGERPLTVGALGSVTLTGADLGEIARGLVALALQHVGGDLPLVLPTARPGTARIETFPGGRLHWVADQLTELTKRQDAAPDIRFTCRRRSDDPRYIEWVMETGTAARPQLSQGGADWSFDTTARRGPVLDVEVDVDGQGMGSRSWVTGNGQEDDQLLAVHTDPTLTDAGWPLLELDESRDGVTVRDTLDGYAAALTARRSRPVQVWRLAVRADAALEVLEGDYARVTIRGDDYLPDGVHRMRVQKISGQGQAAVLDMYPLEG